MNTETVYPILAGKRALVVGVANEHSIAWGCALAFRKLGAEVILTYLNEKAYPHVAPLAADIDAQLLPLDVTHPGQLEALFAVLAFPLLLPLLIIAVETTEIAMAGGGWANAAGGLRVLAAYSLAQTVASLLLFERVWEA